MPPGDCMVDCGTLKLSQPTIGLQTSEAVRGPKKPHPCLRGQPASNLQTCVTRKQTVTPMATGMSVATDVHFTLRVSL